MSYLTWGNAYNVANNCSLLLLVCWLHILPTLDTKPCTFLSTSIDSSIAVVECWTLRGADAQSTEAAGVTPGGSPSSRGGLGRCLAKEPLR